MTFAKPIFSLKRETFLFSLKSNSRGFHPRFRFVAVGVCSDALTYNGDIGEICRSRGLIKNLLNGAGLDLISLIPICVYGMEKFNIGMTF